MVTNKKLLFPNKKDCYGVKVYFNGAPKTFLNAHERREPHVKTEITTLIEAQTFLL